MAQWRNLLEHRQCQKQGRIADFGDYKITVIQPLRTYGMNERTKAPADSKAFFVD
ncbi:MAG: hypothetical protein MR210_08355 [Erysipelotrichaceae bacterium]|nr:hypothetical protein [Erysipelotrichaceae bacterium]MDY5251228.1 hypothetical protein [Erysipelotrichaceae bacterium]